MKKFCSFLIAVAALVAAVSCDKELQEPDENTKDPVEDVIPDKKPDEGEKPDEGKKPEEGTEPGDNPDSGTDPENPDPGTDPGEGTEPGDNPDPGTDPDNPDPGTDPGEGTEPDDNPDLGTDPENPDPGTDPGDNPDPVDMKTVYFKPNEEWKADGAQFGAHFWEPVTDVMMADSDGDGIYEVEVSNTLESVIFVRLASDAEGFGWGGWQTADLTVENECFALDYSGNFGTWMTLEDAKVYAPEPPAVKSYLYLKPNANWIADNARFAAYFFGAGERWMDMTDEDADGIYELELPAGYPNVIFCRMNPSEQANNWDNKWNQTSDLTVPTDGTNLYTVADGTWDNGGGEWSVFE